MRNFNVIEGAEYSHANVVAAPILNFIEGKSCNRSRRVQKVCAGTIGKSGDHVYTLNHNSRIQKSYPMQSPSLPTCPMVKIPPKPLNEEEVDVLVVGRFREWPGMNNIDMKDANYTCIPIWMGFIIVMTSKE